MLQRDEAALAKNQVEKSCSTSPEVAVADVAAEAPADA